MDIDDADAGVGQQDEAKELSQQIGDVMKTVNQEVKQAKREAVQ